MSRKANKSYVAKIELKNNTYYVTDRSDITLDSETYQDVVRSWGDVSYYSDTLDGKFQIGSMEISVVNGEQFIGGGYTFSPTDVWNNYTCEVKLYTDGDVEFDSCIPIINGKIKNYTISEDVISFTVEQIDERDDIMLPQIVCEDQSSLEDADARRVPISFNSAIGYDEITFATGEASIFDIGELVLLRFSQYEVLQYVQIYYKDDTNSIIRTRQNVFYLYYTMYVEKAFRNIPENNVGKTIPIQIGDLNDSSNGVFAKTITLNQKLGEQIVLADYHYLYYMGNIGIWDKGLKRYYVGRGNTGSSDDEYTISLEKNSAIFSVDTTTTLSIDLSSTAGIVKMYVTSPASIPWIDCGDVDSTVNPELITNNILRIDNELLLMVSKPDETETIQWVQVERGYNGTDVATHSAGTAIYMADKYSSKNLITFTELFLPKNTTSVYTYQWDPGLGFSADTHGIEGMLENITKNDSTYALFNFDNDHRTEIAEHAINFDLQFANIALDAKVIGVYAALDFSAFYSVDPANSWTSWLMMAFGNPNLALDYGESYPDSTSKYHIFLYMDRAIGESGTSSKNNVDAISRDSEIIQNGDLFIPDLSEVYGGTTLGFAISNLKDLNNLWKLYIFTLGLYDRDDTDVCNLKTYRMGLWVDFFIDFTKENIVSAIEGRKITSDVEEVTGSVEGSLCEHPVDVCAQLLTQELGYEIDDFTNTWQSAKIFPNYLWQLYDVPNYMLNGCYGDGVYVIVGNNGNIMTSEDGISYIPRTSGTSVGLYTVCYGDGVFATVSLDDTGPNGYLLTSSDGGITWVKRYLSYPYRSQAICYGNGVFVTIGLGDAIFTSSDGGVTWIKRVADPSDSVSWQDIVFGNNIFVACGQGGSQSKRVTLSYDNGVTWYLIDTPVDKIFGKMIFANNIFVMFAYSTYHPGYKVFTSENGENWTNHASPYVGSSSGVYGKGCYFNGIFYNVVLYVDSEEYNLVYSYNGMEWFTMTGSPSNYNYRCIFNSGDKLVATPQGLTPKKIMVLTDVVDSQSISFSYGIDDKRQKGFDFVAQIANHFNYFIFKNYEGKLDIINIYNIYNNTETGNKIEIEEISFLEQSGQRRITIYQTGTDLIYNDFVIKYKRNNSTNEYQAVYKLPDTFTMVKSGITLKQARTDYYGGKKRTYEIESPYIYQESDAQRLAETLANQFAEAHFYSELVIDFDHYTEINSLSEQYKIGTIIYLNGSHVGITFDSDRKFRIQDVMISDVGRELQLHLMSLDPISEF